MNMHLSKPDNFSYKKPYKPITLFIADLFLFFYMTIEFVRFYWLSSMPTFDEKKPNGYAVAYTY